nr:hypothetical protein [Mucilaginibacter sp. L294]
MSTENTPINDPDGTIPVVVAKEWAANWRTYLGNSDAEFVARSFIIPIIDFQNILLYNPNAESVRAYIGLEDAADPLTAKLLLVPVENGQEILVKDIVGGGLGGPNSNVYDFTRACPPECPAPTPNQDTLES